MANSCKFQKTQYQVSYDSGTTWEDVVPTQFAKGELIEYDSPDCNGIDVNYRWRLLEGQYICDGNKKYTKEIQEESYNNGITWYTSYPTQYRQGQYVGEDSEFCCDKFIGHYEYDPHSTNPHDCGFGYIWNGKSCVRKPDPIKVIKCDGFGELTSADTSYYTWKYTIISAEIGDSVTSINTNAFSGCTALTSVTINITTPPTLGANAFIYTPISGGTGHIYVPCSAVNTYRASNNWSTYASQIVGYESCTTYNWVVVSGEYICSEGDKYEKLKKVRSFDGGTTWEDVTPYEYSSGSLIESGSTDCVRFEGKFLAHYSNSSTYSAACDSDTILSSGTTKPSGYEYSAMTSAEIGDCITIIDAVAFRNCTSLSSITIPDSVIYILEEAFNNCIGLISVTIGSGVTEIDESVFNDCTSLTSVTIPSNVTSIGDYAFSNCSSLTSITMERATPPTLGEDIFWNTNNCPIYVPSGSVNIYKSAFGWSSEYASRIQAIPT